MTGTVVVLGASGGIGRALVEHLASQGRQVRAVARSLPGHLPAGVEAFPADVSTPDGAGAAVSGASVVHHAAQPPYTRWPQEFPALTSTIARAAAVAGARLVLADNLYCFGPVRGPIREDSPQAAVDSKGVVRRDMAADLLARHERGDLDVVIGRASDYFGPGGRTSALGESVFERAVAGRAARWPADADQPHTASFLPDVARALVALGDHPAAGGRAWHLPAAPPVTGRAFVGTVAEVLGRPVRLSVVPPTLLRAVGVVVPLLREVAATSHQWDRPFVVDDSAYRGLVGEVSPTRLEDAVAETVGWWRSQGRGRRSGRG